MQTLPKDVRFEIAMKLKPYELINFCISEKKQNREICESEVFWRRKLEKDYPEEFKSNKMVKNSKQRYMERFTYVSRAIEKFIPQLITDTYGELFNDWLNDAYVQELYNDIFDLYYETTNINKEIDRGKIENSRLMTRFIFLFPNFDEDINPFELIVDFIINLQRDEIDNQKGEYDRDRHYTERYLQRDEAE